MTKTSSHRDFYINRMTIIDIIHYMYDIMFDNKRFSMI